MGSFEKSPVKPPSNAILAGFLKLAAPSKPVAVRCNVGSEEETVKRRWVLAAVGGMGEEEEEPVAEEEEKVPIVLSRRASTCLVDCVRRFG